MSYVAPRFCTDRVMPYPREGVILAQATDRSNLQHNLLHPDLVFANAIYGMKILRRMSRWTLNGSRLISVVVLVTYQVTVGRGV